MPSIRLDDSVDSTWAILRMVLRTEDLGQLLPLQGLFSMAGPDPCQDFQMPGTETQLVQVLW